jgi:hypothetical protein
MAKLIITAVTVEGRTKSEVARDYGVSRYWVGAAACAAVRTGRPDCLPAAVPAAASQPAHRRRRHRGDSTLQNYVGVGTPAIASATQTA